MIRQFKKNWLESFFIALPFLPAWPLGVPWTRLFISGVGLAWVAGALKKRSIILPVGPAFLAILAFIFFATLSFLWTPDLEGGLRKALVFWSIAPLFLLVRSFAVRGRLLNALAAGSAISALAGITVWAAQFFIGADNVTHLVAALNPFIFGQSAADNISSFQSWYVEIQGRAMLRSFFPFPDPHTAALFWGMGLAVALAAESSKLKVKSSRQVVSRWLQVFGLAAALVTTFARSAYLILFVLGVFLAFQKRKFSAALPLLFLILFLLATPLVSERFTSIAALDEGSIAGRLALWDTAWNVFKEHPLFGAGLGGFSYAADPSANIGDPVNAHSTYLEIASELGLIGLFFFAASLFFGFFAALEGESKNAAIAAGILVFAVHAIFEIDLYSPPNLAALFLFLSLAGQEERVVSSNY